MKLKKLLAGALISVLAVGCIPNMTESNLDVVEAVKIPTETTGWTWDEKNANWCKLLVQYTGRQGSENNNPPDEERGYIENEGYAIDSKEDTQVIVRGHTSTGVYDYDAVQTGDYIGIQYKYPIAMKRFKIIYDELYKNGDAVLEYTTDAKLSSDSWKTIKENVKSPNGNKFTIEEAFDDPIEGVYGVRLRTTSVQNCWLKVWEIAAEDANVLNITEDDLHAGSQHPDDGDHEGVVKYLLDNNRDTYWHSNWANESGQYQKFWLDIDVTDDAGNAQYIDRLLVQSRPANINTNGRIEAYEIWVKEEAATENDFVSGTKEGVTDLDKYPWQASYKKVCEGTWKDDGSWNVTEFEAPKVKHVRILAKTTFRGTTLQNTPDFVSIAELKVVGSSGKDFTGFKGMSLRKKLSDGTPYENYDKTSIRFGYELYDVAGYTMSDWSWRWGLSPDSMKATVDGEYKTEETTGVYTTNLVIQNVPKEYYSKPIYAELITEYTNEDGEKLILYSGVEERDIESVATEALENPNDADYAQKLLDVLKGSAD